MHRSRSTENADRLLKTETQLAQKATNFLGGARKFMAALGTLCFVAAFVASFLVEQQPDPKIMAALENIQRTANQTLAAVGEVKKQLDAIAVTLDRIEKQILSLKCGTSVKLLVEPRAYIQDKYDTYNQTLLPLIKEAASRRVEPAASTVDAVDSWANEVILHMGEKINTIGIILAGDEGLSQDMTLISECGRAFANDVAAQKPLPVDDRTVYNQILPLTATMLMMVHRGANLLTEAHEWRAQRAYRAALKSYVTSSCAGNITLCPSFGTVDMPLSLGELCAMARANASSGLPYSVAEFDCRESNRIADKVRAVTLRAMELMGAPYSFGDKPGEGVRLVLGADVLPPSNKSKPLPDYAQSSVWLVPASPGAFDPACTFPNATAESGCSLIGDFDDTTGASWAHLKYPLGIDAKLWQATPAPWLVMR